ncbi:DEAD/DEAH box helicase [Microbulbifer sp. CAU 1566]|uniref:DEAD/DEAH box helicase n=1 Tax=Microbulbifer sp. CAU 1566 TaxID=2933269 RepID=UPI0020060921|nr:DEAD/DEAH box helicase [Microbulbifer sp. CAU 1566]MCK7599004.1 DEAD/DEAH box helicase [Microbulbifer sp. CAU 1566]
MRTFALKNIHQMANERSFARGEDYFLRGRVQEAYWDEDAEVYRGRVKGSARYVYRVELGVERSRLVGLCSCPVSLNCKHAVAVALEILEQEMREQESAGDGPVSGAPSTPNSPIPANPAWLDWLNDLPQAPREGSGPLEYGHHYLLYVLEENTQGLLQLSTKKGYLKKDGSWSQIRYFNQDTKYLSWNRPSHLLDEDVTILELLPRINAAGRLGLIGEQGRRALTYLLESNRFYFDDSVIQRAPARRLQWQWKPDESGNQQLEPVLEGMNSASQWRLIPVVPPCYLDTENICIGDITTPLPTGQLIHLMEMPPVPEKEFGLMAAQLRRQIPISQLPLPVEPKLTQTSEFTPRITLVGCDFDHYKLPALKLHFNYAGLILSPSYSSEFEGLEVIRESDGEYLQVIRDMLREHQCNDQIYDQGLYLIPENLGGQKEVWVLDATKPEKIFERWSALLRNQIPEWQKQGWIVETDPSYRFDISRAKIAMELTDSTDISGNWFELGLDLTLPNGQQWPIVDLIEQWLEQDAPDQLSIIADGDWISVDTKPLQSIRGLLLDLLKEKALGRPVRLPAFQAAQFSGIEGLDQRHAPITQKLMETLQDFSGLQIVPKPKHLNATLRPYQQDGLNWLVFLQQYGFGGILADDMGLGKTLQTLALVQYMKETGALTKPAMVVAPTSLTGNWVREAAQFTPQLKTTLIHGPARDSAFDQIKDSDLVITTYPLLARDQARYRNRAFSLLALDEAQAIKNPTTKIAECVRLIHSDTRLCLSGTPLENHLGELWSLMDFALPGLLGGRKSFQQAYRTPIEGHGNHERQRELAQKVRPFMLRRTKSEVVAELPPKTESIQYVELGSKQRALYESVRISMEKRIRDLVERQGMGKSHIEFLDALLKLRQTCIDPRLVKLEKAAGIHESAKLNWLQENLPQLLEEGRNILIFSQFTQVLKLVEEQLNAQYIDYSKLTGQTRKRQQAIDSFQNGDVRVFLISLKAGGAGLNLTAADVVIHMDPWWNPAVENQATDRAHRIGQDKPVFVYKLVAENTVEERIQQMQKQKQALADALFDATRTKELPASKEDLLALLQR